MRSIYFSVRDAILFALALALAFWAATAHAQIALGGAGPGSGPMKRGNFLHPEQYATQAALTLFVSTTGGDDNATCTDVNSPCLTIQAAVNKIPFLVQHPVTVTVAAGNYAGFALMSHEFAPVSMANGASIVMSGAAQTNTTPATGSATGTVTSVTTDAIGFHVVTDSGQTWTASDTNITTRFLTLTGGTGVGQVLPIVTNTATSVTVAGTFSPAPVAGTTYAITSPSTVLTSAVNQPATGGTAAGTPVAMGLYELNSARGGGTIDTVIISDIGVGAAIRGAQFTNAFGAELRRCRLATTTSTGVILSSQTNVGLIASVIAPTSGGGIFTSSSQRQETNGLTLTNTLASSSTIPLLTSSAPNAGFIRIGSSELVAGGSAVAASSTGFAAVQISGSRLRCTTTSGTFGLALISAGLPANVSFTTGSNSIEGCGTGILANGLNMNVSAHSSLIFLSNTTAVSATGGGKVAFVSAVPTFTTNGTDISVDGATITRAAFVLLVPNSVVNLNYLSAVYLQP